MFKILNEKAPNYLINLIPKYRPTIRTKKNNNVKKNVMLYGDSRFDEVKNRFILEPTITY